MICSADGLTKNTVLEFKTTKFYEPNTYPTIEEWTALVKINKRTGRRSGVAIESKTDWVRRSALYCKVFGKTKTHLCIFFRMADVLRTFTMEFTQEELDDALGWFYPRLKTIRDARVTGVIPPVTARVEEWQCRYCYFLAHGCTKGLENAELSVPEFNDKYQVKVRPEHVAS